MKTNNNKLLEYMQDILVGHPKWSRKQTVFNKCLFY